ncbi:uncharacterized protein BP5553_03738 [Venustampulla echinocandica]|uniref:Phospholipase/carboxylesterase/thioesterase domain-containing protein n=1 Tax=Venustampulla echinocandica TaxID=2656787 RepID=A0A370TVA1_9HELO|nr:uncharacterized protein BP5553_03738 [Venustampulla echinocandica]RDL39398.1 hypothetical protein BP5553_03738 [Venustampulla echinocandica]
MDLTVVIIPPSAPHTHTVIFLHGRGDSAKSCASSLSYSRDSSRRSLSEIFPSFRWVFPQTKMRECEAFPRHKMSQWFDIWNVSDFSQHEELQATGLRESVASIRRLLVSEATILGGQWDHLVLAGISQGAATSVHTLLNLGLPPAAEALEDQQVPCALGAFLGFSCRMPFPGRSLAETRNVLSVEAPRDNNEVLDIDEILRNTPMLLEHRVDDALVPVESGRGLRDTLRGFGAQVTWKEYRNGGHWFNSPAGIDNAVEFLNNHVLKKLNAGEILSSQFHGLSLA